ncbi:MFS transporter [Streptomyces sp. NBC_00299]|uniref:MFS transporter n=1 Tax=Streptomyces sp. NBC_00299 TaxID=2975705 RepID=UPI0032454A59
MSSPSSAGVSPRAGAREWLGLGILALPTLLLALDMSVLYLAVPHLGADLLPSTSQLLWIMDIYGFMIAGFLVTMGTLGDRIGRRKLLLIGAAAFGAASVLAAYAPSAELLILARALLGIAGATLMPSTLALISVMFQDAKQRGSAIGVWMMCFSAGTAIGPLVGGLLLDSFWWGSVFLIGVPVMLVLLVAGPVLLPEYRDPDGGRIDLGSVVLSLLAVLPVIYGIKRFAEEGVDPQSLAGILVGLFFGVVFVRRQRKLDEPLIDLNLFSHRAFSVSLIVLLLSMATVGGTVLFYTQFLQSVEGMSPIKAGLWMLPSAIGMIMGSMATPALAARLAPRVVVGIGMGISAVGYLLLTQVDSVSGLPVLITGVTVAFVGTSSVLVLGTDLVVGSAPPEKAGSAASLSEASSEFGIAFGVATIGTIGTAVYRSGIEDAVPSGLDASAAEDVRDSMAGAADAAANMPELLAAARDAFADGLNVSAGINAAIAAVLAVLALVVLKTTGQGGEDLAETTDPQESPSADVASVGDSRA